MVSNDEIIEIIHKNHVATIERLTRIETTLTINETLPERVAKLEKRDSWYSGVIAGVSALLGASITTLFRK